MTSPFLEVIAEHWRDCTLDLRYRNYSEVTINTYHSYFRSFLRWLEQSASLEGLNSLADLNADLLQDYFVALSLRSSTHYTARAKDAGKTFLSTSTRAGHFGAITVFFKYLTKQKLILLNPMTNLERLKEQRALPRNILTPDEVLRLFAAIDTSNPIGLRNRAALEILYSSGLRSGELAKLDLASVDLAQRTLHVHGKGNKRRYVPIGNQAYQALLAYLEHGRPRLKAAGSKALFLADTQGRISLKTLRSAFSRYVATAKIHKRVSLHSLRHSCATHMLAGSADIRYIQALLGHSSLQSTQVYTRVELSDLKSVLDRCHPRDKF